LPAYGQIMNAKQEQEKRALTFGEFIMAMNDGLGKRRAQRLIRMAVNTRMVEFRTPRRFVVT
jgi:hypothetical protein